MNAALIGGMQKLMLHPQSAQMDGLREMLDAMIAHYQDALLDAKPDAVEALRHYAQQVRQIRRAITDPDRHTPIV